MGRSWPSLIAAIVELVDGRRWNLSSDHARQAILRRPATARGIFEYYALAADAGLAATFDVADRIEREFRALIRGGKIEIRGVDAATGAPVTLPAAAAAIATFDFDRNEMALPGADALRLVGVQVSEAAPPAAPRPAEARAEPAQASRPPSAAVKAMQAALVEIGASLSPQMTIMEKHHRVLRHLNIKAPLADTATKHSARR